MVLITALLPLGWPASAAAAEEPKVTLPLMPDAPRVKLADLSIDHTPLICVAQAKRPRVDARIVPERNLERGYVFFRASGTRSFYYAFLEKGLKEDVSGYIPAPTAETRAIDYYLQALDRQRFSKETARFQPPVRLGEAECSGERAGTPAAPPPEVKTVPVVPPPDSERESKEKREGLVIGLTEEGQDPVPPGFRMSDIAKVILVTGAVVTVSAALGLGTAAVANAAAGAGASAGTGAAAGAGGGATAGAAAGGTAAASAGGISTGVLVAGGVAVAGAGVAVAASGGGSKDPDPAVSMTATPASGSAPLSVTFTANTSSGTSPFTYAWSFGDGQSASGSSTQVHVYRNPSTTPYTAVVTVTDSKGKTAQDQKSITVNPPAPLSFLEVDASWSGPANVDLRLTLNGAAVGTVYPPVSCQSAGNRTSRVLVQQPANGTYTLTATASNLCPGSAETSVTAVFTAITNAGTVNACASVFKSLNVGTATTACTFSLP